jgi:large subunit ribosomal protein L20
MARVKGGMKTRARKKKLFSMTKGYWGGHKNRYRSAMEMQARAGNFAYRDRKARKREFRNLWIARINAAARLNGLSYSRLINGLKGAQIDINRKVMADLAVNDAKAFAELAETAKKHLVPAEKI